MQEFADKLSKDAWALHALVASGLDRENQVKAGVERNQLLDRVLLHLVRQNLEAVPRRQQTDN